MKVPQGGTQMWCPECESVQVCAAVSLSRLGYESGQRWYKSDHPDINWFRRGRVCQNCGCEFVTAELNENFLEELVELRVALTDVKSNAEQYILDSDKASTTLKQLSQSLKILKSLRLYKDAR
ncbi:MAG: hypothetical protein AMXMBFR82_06470 [Candidatus Hydrogenedentota bacterium]